MWTKKREKRKGRKAVTWYDAGMQLLLDAGSNPGLGSSK
jgi:hypothetical protein